MFVIIEENKRINANNQCLQTKKYGRHPTVPPALYWSEVPLDPVNAWFRKILHVAIFFYSYALVTCKPGGRLDFAGLHATHFTWLKLFVVCLCLQKRHQIPGGFVAAWKTVGIAPTTCFVGAVALDATAGTSVKMPVTMWSAPNMSLASFKDVGLPRHIATAIQRCCLPPLYQFHTPSLIIGLGVRFFWVKTV